MTSTKGYKFLQQCRLCRGTEGILNDIFGGDGLCRNLAVKINQCLPILVQKDDLLPKLLCCKCIKKVEQIHSFRKICIQSELFLEASLKEQQAFTLEPKCCLKEIEMQPQRELVDKLARGGLETIPGTQITKSISAECMQCDTGVPCSPSSTSSADCFVVPGVSSGVIFTAGLLPWRESRLLDPPLLAFDLF